MTLATGGLDVGGIEFVVRALAEGLGAEGLAVNVLCTGGGATADALAREGIEVSIVRTREDADAQLRRLGPGVVEVHNAPEHVMAAIAGSGIPRVQVIHNPEIHRSANDWAALSEARVDRWIAVSENVRAFHLAHLPARDQDVVVVPNAAPGVPLAADARYRAAARASLAATAGWPLADRDVLFVCLARYDQQKNIPGLVSAFLAAAAVRPSLRLAVAGPTSDWLEVARADAIRRASPRSDAVVLLGSSSTSRLLAAADGLVLDSFFEGGPVVAIEAVKAGLPVVLSEAGIARELLADGSYGTLVANPATDDTISEVAIRRARRRVGAQRNREELSRAIVDISDEIERWRAARSHLIAAAAECFTVEAMVRGHARWLKDAMTGTVDVR